MKFIALKPTRVTTTVGQAANFAAAGEEKELYGMLAQEAMRSPDVVLAEHAEALREATAKRVEAQTDATKEEAEAEEARKELAAAKTVEIELAIKDLIARGNKEDFTGQGYPRVAAVMDITNREDVSSNEIKEVFDAVTGGTVG